jgi:hypothetical protein
MSVAPIEDLGWGNARIGRHLGDRKPGDASHSLMRQAVSAWPAFLSNRSR